VDADRVADDVSVEHRYGELDGHANDYGLPDLDRERDADAVHLFRNGNGDDDFH
jgi:hypothetical protein